MYSSAPIRDSALTKNRVYAIFDKLMLLKKGGNFHAQVSDVWERE